MGLKYLLGFLAVATTTGAMCQSSVVDQDWKELDAPPAPHFSKDGLLPVEMPKFVTVKVGVDPKTVSVGADGVIHYVVVMQNQSGSVNASFEGILCATGAVKTYARANGENSVWVAVDNPQWKPMTDNLPSRHAYAIAKGGACVDGTPVSLKAADVVRAIQRGLNLYL